MGLYKQWEELAKLPQTQEQHNAFWNDYFDAEKEVYKQILKDKQNKYSGTAKEVAEKLGLEPIVFAAFVDGINTSLKEKINLDSLEEDTPIEMDIDWEKLFFNMNDAKAKWLYTLEEWDGILSKEKRDEITRRWRASKQAVSEKTVGRNDPCPCGSGKKYKKCCMNKDAV